MPGYLAGLSPLVGVLALLGCATTTATRVRPVQSQTISGTALDTPVGLVGGSCSLLRYPPALQAEDGIRSAVVHFVVDTAGKIEPGSLRVLAPSVPDFDRYAIAVARSCRFFPGRVGGVSQRALAWLPIQVEVRGGGTHVIVGEPVS
jgi:TonB family protein